MMTVFIDEVFERKKGREGQGRAGKEREGK